jgi:signal transduction histidine kinase
LRHDGVLSKTTIMDRTDTGRRPSFFWQGLMILLPVTVLAVVGLYSLRQDEQAAEQAARKRAAENVVSLARAMNFIADDQFTKFFFLQYDSMYELRMTMPGYRMGTNDASFTNFQQELKARIVQWQKAYPGLPLDSLAAATGMFTDQGSQLSPTDSSEAPNPPNWFLEFSPIQRHAWQALRESQSKEGVPDAPAGAWQDFLATDPSEESKLASSNYGRLNSPQADQGPYRGFTESGVAFSDLACFQALDRLTNGLWPIDLPGKLMVQVIYSPSFQTSALLEKANEHPPSDPIVQENLRLSRKIWDLDSIARERLLPFRRHPELLASNLWTGSSAGEALARRTDSTNSGIGPDFHVTDIWFVPLPVMEAIFARALAENKFLLPEYVTPAISVEGKQLALPGFVGPSGENLRLGEAAQKCENCKITFTLAFYLGSREKMLAGEQRRARLFGALIGAAVLAALAGFFTARRGFYEQHRLSEMKSNFVSSVSHELRAPIASMRLLAESLERGKIPEASKQQEYYRFLVQESRRLTSLIENVLDFSRIEQGRKEYQMEPSDLDAIAEQTVKLMLPAATQKQVELIWHPGPGPGPAPCCDGLAIQQTLINLIDNAIKHSAAGATVTVGREGAAPAPIHLWVEDQGPGIPPEEHEKIFERFYRRGSELRRETQGVGIGLTIVKHIVEAHGGRILVRSAVGQGSRFTIELPATPEHP